MDIDVVALLAAQVTTFLAPYLVKGGEAFASETGKRLAEKLYGMFKPKIEAKDSAKEAAQDVRDAPEDKRARAFLEHQIKKILAEDVSITIGNVDLSSIQGDYNIIVEKASNSNFAAGEGAQLANTWTRISRTNTEKTKKIRENPCAPCNPCTKRLSTSQSRDGLSVILHEI